MESNSNVYEVDLPSSSSEILNYPKKVKISTLGVSSFKLYANITDENALSIFKNILRVCIKDDIDIGKLKLQDALFLIMWLRINSAIPGSNDEYEYVATCNNTKDCTDFSRKVSLSSIEIKPLVGCVEPSTINLFSEEGKTLDLKLMTLDEEIEMLDSLVNKDPFFVDNIQIVRAAYTIDSPLKLKEKIKVLDSLHDLRDLAAILNFLSMYTDWGFTFLDKRVKCPKCGKENDTVLPLSVDIYTPKLRADGYFERARESKLLHE